MRKFWLEDPFGKKVSCSDPGKLWFENPSGLGYSMARGYESIKPGFFVKTSSEEDQVPLTGTLTLRAQPYSTYASITDWLCTIDATSERPMKIVYSPEKDVQYYRDVSVDVISKGELSKWGPLECPVTINPLSPLYTRQTVNITISPAVESYKQYDYTYPYYYIGYLDPASEPFEIGGHYPGELELEANGPLANPILTVTKTNTRELCGKIDLTGTSIARGEKLVYSSRGEQAGIWIVEDGIKTDLIDRVELYADTEVFFTIPPHTPLTVTIEVSGVLATTAVLKVYTYYRTR